VAMQSSAEREQTIIRLYPMVRRVAQRMAGRMPRHVEFDELVSTGMLGLIDAVDRYDPGRGVPIEAYAEIRIRGAIVDAMRQSDWVPRAVRRRSTQIEQARTGLRNQLGREPDRAEVAAELGVSEEAYDDLASSSQIRRLVALDGGPDDDRPAIQVASGDPDAASQWIASEEREAVMAAMHELPEKERFVATLYYEHGLQLKEIGAQLGVTEGRVSQLRSQAVQRLRKRLRTEGGLDR
jgi:RNA polymerase sigma factor for flagellar operon FliA